MYYYAFITQINKKKVTSERIIVLLILGIKINFDTEV